MRLRFFVAAAALLSASLAAHADTYTYDIDLFGYQAIFSEPSILMSDTIIQASSLESGSNPEIAYAEINPTSGNCSIIMGGNACADMVLIPGYTLSDAFTNGPLTTPGVTYTDVSNTVTITDVPNVVPTPEPSSFILLGTGLLGVAGAMRRRLL